MILIAVVCFLVIWGLAAPDSWTLRTTRGAAGAIRAGIGSGKSPRSSGPPRSTRSTGSGPAKRTRSGNPRRSGGRPDPPDRSTPTRSDPPRSGWLARSIRGWMAGSDRAVQRRGETVAAIRELFDRIRARRLAQQIAEAEIAAYEEDDRRERAKQRARNGGGAAEIAERIPPIELWTCPQCGRLWPRKPPDDCSCTWIPNNPNGAPVPDFTHTTTTELSTLDELESEVTAASALAEQIFTASRELAAWLLQFPERYTGATDLYKTGQMNASYFLLRERNIAPYEIELGKIVSQLDLLMRGIQNAKSHVKESDAQTGRVESAISQ